MCDCPSNRIHFTSRNTPPCDTLSSSWSRSLPSSPCNARCYLPHRPSHPVLGNVDRHSACFCFSRATASVAKVVLWPFVTHFSRGPLFVRFLFFVLFVCAGVRGRGRGILVTQVIATLGSHVKVFSSHRDNDRIKRQDVTAHAREALWYFLQLHETLPHQWVDTRDVTGMWVFWIAVLRGLPLVNRTEYNGIQF